MMKSALSRLLFSLARRGRGRELAERGLRLFAEIAVGEVADDAFEVHARGLAHVLGRERLLVAGRGLRQRLLALPFEQVDAAHARDVERLVDLREFGVARDQLVRALERGEVRLLVLEVVARDLEFVL